MGVIAGERKAIPSANPKPKPKVATSNPFGNLGIEGSGAATRTAVAPPAAAPAPAPAPPPAPLDFNALAINDPEYTTGQALLARQNTMNIKALRDAWMGSGQQAQDSANAHGSLFSGAAVNAQVHNDQAYADAQAKQALDFDQGGHGLYFSVFNRLKQQLGNLGVTDGSS